MKTKPIFFFLLPFAFTLSAFAGSATWSLNPTSGDWNTAANWTPATVPNGPADTATFEVSNKTAVSLTATTEADGVVFTPGASAFTITTTSKVSGETVELILSGAGVTNNSGSIQNFLVSTQGFKFGNMEVTNNATAGSNNVFTVASNPVSGLRGSFLTFSASSSAGESTFIVLGDANSGGQLMFEENSTASTATFINNGFISIGGDSTAADGIFMNVNDSSGSGGGLMLIGSTAGAGNATFTVSNHSSVEISSTAANGTFSCEGSPVSDFSGGSVSVFDTGAAGNASIMLEGGLVSGGFGGSVSFQQSATAENAVIVADGGTVDGATGGLIAFSGADNQSDPGATAGNSTITANGATVSGASGAQITFTSAEDGNANCNAGNATLIANGGTNGGGGGLIGFFANSEGGTPRVALFGNASLDVSERLTINNVAIGSLEGDGFVYLGSTLLKVGGNNLDTIFSGVIQETGGVGTGVGGSLSKLGTGTLTLSGASTYTGGTTISAGILAVANKRGSATGTGTVQVTRGTLGGKGTISGAVTVGTTTTPTFVAPALGTPRQAALTVQSSITFNSNSTYTCTFKAKNKRAKTDKIVANGVTIASGANIALTGLVQGQLQSGLVLTLVSNTSANPISGTFSNLPDGAIVNIDGNNFQASYTGGDGNDLTLTVVH